MKLETRIKKIEELTSNKEVGTAYHEEFKKIIDDMRKTFGMEKD